MFSLVGSMFPLLGIIIFYRQNWELYILQKKNMFLMVRIMFPLLRNITLQAKLRVITGAIYVFITRKNSFYRWIKVFPLLWIIFPDNIIYWQTILYAFISKKYVSFNEKNSFTGKNVFSLVENMFQLLGKISFTHKIMYFQ